MLVTSDWLCQKCLHAEKKKKTKHADIRRIPLGKKRVTTLFFPRMLDIFFWLTTWKNIKEVRAETIL